MGCWAKPVETAVVYTDVGRHGVQLERTARGVWTGEAMFAEAADSFDRGRAIVGKPSVAAAIPACGSNCSGSGSQDACAGGSLDGCTRLGSHHSRIRLARCGDFHMAAAFRWSRGVGKLRQNALKHALPFRSTNDRAWILQRGP